MVQVMLTITDSSGATGVERRRKSTSVAPPDDDGGGAANPLWLLAWRSPPSRLAPRRLRAKA
jgi:hypothetical protein